MISNDTIKISLFATKVKSSWNDIKDNHDLVIQKFYSDFVNLFLNKDPKIIASNFTYSLQAGLTGLLIFQDMVEIFRNKRSLFNSCEDFSIEISLGIISYDYHKKSTPKELVKILNPLLATEELDNIRTCIKIIRDYKNWKTHYILTSFYKECLEILRHTYNESSISLYFTSNFYRKSLALLARGFSRSRFEYINISEIYFHPMCISLLSNLNREILDLTFHYTEGIGSSILLYLLWIARENMRLESFNVQYIKKNKDIFSESFIRHICDINQIPLSVRIVNEKEVDKFFMKDYFLSAKHEMLAKTGYTIVSQDEPFDNNESLSFFDPLKYFTYQDKKKFVDRYKIPFDKIKEDI